MKIFIILSTLCAFTYGLAPEVIELIKTHAMEVGKVCQGEVGASESDVKPLLQHQVPTTRPGKCLLACMHKKEGFQDASGKINKDLSTTSLEKLKALDADYYEKIKHMIETCIASGIEKDDECETAAAMLECGLKEKVKMGIPMIDFE
ncbi:hypothetical protein FQA39_LY04397 [Lamprigera yunnana]|nr:hypothetical protein FQA39_LY04397 [Lamprigera yunnana]